jgi:hypothetical protein
MFYHKERYLIFIAGAAAAAIFCFGKSAAALTTEEAQLVAELRAAAQKGNTKPLFGEELFAGKTTGLLDPSRDVRAYVAQAIGDFARPADARQLEKFLSSEKEEYVKNALARAKEKLQVKGENELISRLWEQASTNKDLSFFLGDKLLADGKASGLADQSPRVRSISAEIVAAVGSETEVSRLLTAAQSEQDPQARKDMFLSYVKAGLQHSPDSKGFLKWFLASCAKPEILFRGKEAPLDALRFAARQAAANGMAVQLGELKQALAGNQEAAAIISRCQSFAALENSPQGQQDANKRLVELFAQHNREYRDLKEGLEARGILRSENLNPCLEFGGNFPIGWAVDLAQAAVYPAAQAHSFARAIDIKGSGRQAKLTNEKVIFAGRKPSGVEFGLAYKTLSAEAAPSLRLILRMELSDGSAATREFQKQLYPDAQWMFINEAYERKEAGIGVQSAQLQVIIEGPAQVLLDDLYVRRSEGSFASRPPQITAVSARPQACLLRNYRKLTGGKGQSIQLSDEVFLRAKVEDADGDPVACVWSSDRQGGLGEGAERRIRLTRAGTHRIKLAATDSFGNTDTAYINVEAVMPQAFLAIVSPETACSSCSGKASLANQPFKASGKVKLKLRVSGVEDIVPAARVYAVVFANGQAVAGSGSSEREIVIDSARLQPGATILQAKVFLRSKNPLPQKPPKGYGSAKPYASNAIRLEREQGDKALPQMLRAKDARAGA